MADVLHKAILQVRFTGQILHATRWSRRKARHGRLAIDEKLDDDEHHREWQQPAEDHSSQQPAESDPRNLHCSNHSHPIWGFLRLRLRLIRGPRTYSGVRAVELVGASPEPRPGCR